MWETHPAAEIFPLMEGVAFDELVEDIREHGQKEPVKLLGGKVLDGRNRVRACFELNIEPRAEELPPDTDPEAYVQSANVHRRHLRPSELARYREDRRVRVAALRREGASTRDIADEVGVSQPTVLADLKAAERDRGFSPDEVPERVTGADGKTYPATRPTPAAPAPEPAPDDGRRVVTEDDGDPGPVDVPPPPGRRPPVPTAAEWAEEGKDLEEAGKRLTRPPVPPGGRSSHAGRMTRVPLDDLPPPDGAFDRDASTKISERRREAEGPCADPTFPPTVPPPDAPDGPVRARYTDVEVAERYSAALEMAPPHGSLWRHKGTGGVYLVGPVTLDSGTLVPIQVYVGRDTGVTWSRPLLIFLRRFERIDGETEVG